MFENVSRRQFLQASGVAALGLGLVGCSGGSDGGSSDGGSSDGADTITVGILGPHTGEVSQYGIACRNGAQLYFDQVNAAGGINGKQLNVLVEDEQGDPTTAVNAYNLLVEQGVVGIVGDVTTGPTIAMAQVAAEDNMPCVTPSATAADVVSYGSNMFRACVTDPEQGRIMANFAQSQGYANVATLFLSGDDYSEGVNDAFVAECKNLSVNVTTEEAYSAGDTDFNAQITTIIGTSPDAVLVPNYYEDDGMIVTQARQQGYTGVILGVDGWSGITDYASAADLQNCYYCCAFTANNDDESVQQFISDYTDKYGEAPANFDALGYDAAMVLVNGITAAEEAGLEAGSDEYLQAVIDGIAGGSVEGVTGTIAYEGTGDPVKSTLIIAFAEDGTEEIEEVFEA